MQLFDGPIEIDPGAVDGAGVQQLPEATLDERQIVPAAIIEPADRIQLAEKVTCDFTCIEEVVGRILGLIPRPPSPDPGSRIPSSRRSTLSPFPRSPHFRRSTVFLNNSVRA